MKRIEKQIDKVKYAAFEKVKTHSKGFGKTSIENCKDELLKAQRIEIKSQLKRIKNIKHMKGKTSAAFEVLGHLKGSDKRGNEITAMKDPVTGDMILEPDRIREVALAYCVNLLHFEYVDPDFEKEIYLENLLHYYRYSETSENEINLEYSDFEARISIVASKHSEKYKFLLNLG